MNTKPPSATLKHCDICKRIPPVPKPKNADFEVDPIGNLYRLENTKQYLCATCLYYKTMTRDQYLYPRKMIKTINGKKIFYFESNQSIYEEWLKMNKL